MTKLFTRAALAATVATGLLAAPAVAANLDTKPFTATAKLEKPLLLTKKFDLDFGTISMLPTLTSAVVSVAQDGTPGCGTGLTCTAPVAAAFTVAGIALQELDVEVEEIAFLTDAVSSETVAFSAFAPATVVLDPAGSAEFNIGGSITVEAGNDAGTYSADIDVTVSYQ